MTQVEEVVYTIEELNELKKKRKEIQEELKTIEEKRTKEIVEPRQKLENQLKGIRTAIFASPYVRVEVSTHENPYTGIEHDSYSYYIGDILIGDSKYFNQTADEIENMTDEQKVEAIKKALDPKISNIKKENVKLYERRKETDEKLAGLYAERATTPWYAFAKKRELKTKIEAYEKEIENINENIEYNNTKINELEKMKNSREYINDGLKAVEEIVKNLRNYAVKENEIKDKEAKLKEKDDKLYKEYKENKDELKETAQRENELIMELAKSSDKVKALEKISKDPNVDKETREVASKLIKIIANQIKEKNTKKK